MFAVALGAATSSPVPASDLAGCLGSSVRRPTLKIGKRSFSLAAWSGPAAEQTIACEGSIAAAFDGWIGNRARLRHLLALGPNAADVELYLSAYRRWGDDCDRHVHGNYAAAIVEGNGANVRLARSPYSAPPIHYRLTEEHCVAGSLLSVMTAAPGSQRLVPDLRQAARGLAGDRSCPREGWSEGTARVAKGEAVRIAPGAGEARLVWNYSRAQIETPTSGLGDEEVVTAVRALLDEAIGGVVGETGKVALALSGGLDSGLVASHLNAPGAGPKVSALTVAPAGGWEGIEKTGYVSDESGKAAAIAKQAGIRQHKVLENGGGPFDENFSRILEKAGCAPVAIGLAPFLETLARAASESGAQILVGADEGNSGISADGQWGYRELFLRLRWRELWLALRHRPRDPRPMWRKFASLVVRSRQKKQHIAGYLALRGLRREAVLQLGLSGSAGQQGRSRHSTALEPSRLRDDLLTNSDDGAAEIAKAVEAVHGIPYRDPMAYPPLLELCLSLPTSQFLRGGQTRFLARRLAEGRLPEEVRLSTDHGVTDADWPGRLRRDRPELLAELRRMRADEELDRLLDLSGMEERLSRWDGERPGDPLESMALSYCLPAAIAAGRVVARAKGRNDI